MSTNTKLAEALRNLLADTQHAEHPDCEEGPCPVREAREAIAAHDAEQAQTGHWVATVEVIDGEPVDYETVPGFALPDGEHKLYAAPVEQAAPAVPAYTEGHCKEKAKPGGCQLHNLHCGYPACDRKAAPAAPAPEAHK